MKSELKVVFANLNISVYVLKVLLNRGIFLENLTSVYAQFSHDFKIFYEDGFSIPVSLRYTLWRLK